MKDYYIESKNSMGYVLMHVGKFKSYKDFKHAVNSYINSTCVDNYYREFKVYIRPLQKAISLISILGMKIKIKTIDDISKVDLSKYYCEVTELFRTDKDIEKYQNKVA